jgi:hypothetical protein
MCDKTEAADGGLRWNNVYADGVAGENARAGTGRMNKDHVMGLLHSAARDLETQAAGVRRLADIVNVAGEHEYPLFAALAAVVRK